jgi:hypothetical protein
VGSGELDRETLRHLRSPTEALNRPVRGIKGVGPYASHTLLMLLRRDEEVAIDAETRAFLRWKLFLGEKPPD